MSGRSHETLRRALDLVISIPTAAITAPIAGAGWIAAAISTRTKGLFRQMRVGRNGVEFDVFKLRTMVPTPSISSNFTAANDPRITRVGAVLRSTKVDELPQIWQVIAGQMALVGPRPDIADVVACIPEDQRPRILTMSPGVTGPATLFFRDEEEILEGVDDPEQFSLEVLLPCKTAINLAYLAHGSIVDDLFIIWSTLTGGGPHTMTDRIDSWDPTVLQAYEFQLLTKMRHASD